MDKDELVFIRNVTFYLVMEESLKGRRVLT